MSQNINEIVNTKYYIKTKISIEICSFGNCCQLKSNKNIKLCKNCYNFVCSHCIKKDETKCLNCILKLCDYCRCGMPCDMCTICGIAICSSCFRVKKNLNDKMYWRLMLDKKFYCAKCIK